MIRRIFSVVNSLRLFDKVPSQSLVDNCQMVWEPGGVGPCTSDPGEGDMGMQTTARPHGMRVIGYSQSDDGYFVQWTNNDGAQRLAVVGGVTLFDSEERQTLAYLRYLGADFDSASGHETLLALRQQAMNEKSRYN